MFSAILERDRDEHASSIGALFAKPLRFASNPRDFNALVWILEEFSRRAPKQVAGGF
jgi:hypothetical protein